jgi:hypothetical protein
MKEIEAKVKEIIMSSGQVESYIRRNPGLLDHPSIAPLLANSTALKSAMRTLLGGFPVAANSSTDDINISGQNSFLRAISQVAEAMLGTRNFLESGSLSTPDPAVDYRLANLAMSIGKIAVDTLAVNKGFAAVRQDYVVEGVNINALLRKALSIAGLTEASAVENIIRRVTSPNSNIKGPTAKLATALTMAGVSEPAPVIKQVENSAGVELPESDLDVSKVPGVPVFGRDAKTLNTSSKKLNNLSSGEGEGVDEFIRGTSGVMDTVASSNQVLTGVGPDTIDMAAFHTDAGRLAADAFLPNKACVPTSHIAGSEGYDMVMSFDRLATVYEEDRTKCYVNGVRDYKTSEAMMKYRQTALIKMNAIGGDG